MPETNNEQKTVKMSVYKNTSKVALTIPELNLVIPAGGFSSPIPAATESINEYVKHGMLTAEEVTVPEMPAGTNNTAVTSGNGTPTEMQGKPAPAVATPGPQYIPVMNTDSASRVRNYEGKAGVKDAVQHTVVAIRDGANPNPYGEIPPESMAGILKQHGRDFSSEVPLGEYVEDQAQQIIARSVGAVTRTAAAQQPLPPDTPTELRAWLQQTPLQKKIAVFKSNDAAFLTNVRNYERDANVISCIDTKLTELAAGK